MLVPDSAPKALHKVKLFAGLSPEELGKIEVVCRYKRFSANEQIFDRNSKARDVFFVIRGKVRVVNYSLAGREITLDDISEGEYFGELAALDGQPRSASIMALTDCLIVALSPVQFVQVLERHPKVALRALRRLSQIVRRSTERIMDLSTLGANNRVHADLLRLAEAGDKKDNTVMIRPIPVHGDIASRIGTTRETVARVLNDLARRGIVKRTKDALVISDMARLHEMVEDVRG
ncbi:MAG: Crp/Fnr family transcriptional regulator [Proteobacteria bacterium]|nr:Crp/Fnr family transcriptional regulator [Pseudomonadota bacterium]